MKKITILFVALIMFGSIGVSLADPPPPGQIGPPPPGQINKSGPSFALFDSTGQEIGEVITINPIAVGVGGGSGDREPRGVLTRMQFTDSDGFERNVGLFFTGSDLPFVNPVLFKSTDCTGNDHFLGIAVVNGEFPNAFDPVAIVPAVTAPDTLDFSQRILYTSKVEDDPPEVRTFSSQIFPARSNECRHITLNIESVRAVKLNSGKDLFATHRPDYTLEVD